MWCVCGGRRFYCFFFLYFFSRSSFSRQNRGCRNSAKIRRKDRKKKKEQEFVLEASSSSSSSFPLASLTLMDTLFCQTARSFTDMASSSVSMHMINGRRRKRVSIYLSSETLSICECILMRIYAFVNVCMCTSV
mgnify:CR=1 FL=1